jgi:hypothetical protein
VSASRSPKVSRVRPSWKQPLEGHETDRTALTVQVRELSPGSSASQTVLLQPEFKEDAFAATEDEARKAELPSHFVEAEATMECDRGAVAGVGEEPCLVGTFKDPAEPSFGQCRTDARATQIRSDEEPRQVVAARSCVARRI